jgi:uncharacterized repeat protein (TIGR01451 family)
MKKTFYLLLCALSVFISKIHAQYYIASHSWPSYTDSGMACGSPRIYLTTNAYATGLSIRTFPGEGTSITNTINNGGTYGYANINCYYKFPGNYTIKQVLYNGAIPVDSIVYLNEYLYCSTIILRAFNDANGDGIRDVITEHPSQIPFNAEVRKNGVLIDTIPMISCNYYHAVGALGDIFSFKILTDPSYAISTPSSTIIYDTIKAISNHYVEKYFGIKCTATTSFDLGLYTSNVFTRGNHMATEIYAYNKSCNAINATVKVYFGPKYVYQGEANPAPSSVTSNSLTWDIAGLDGYYPGIYYRLENHPVTGHLFMGDTVQSYYTISPTSGDANPANNQLMIIDTVTSSYDPNDVSVIPSGHIASGTKLQYTINFENTGNDTAFNISVYDTLSNNVDVKSLNILMASSFMSICVLNYGGYNIVKFDFPNINLPDSSHHGLCDGSVIFTVNAKNGLVDGTTINNRAGIYFDYNPVVMTNTVQNIIGVPTSINTMSNLQSLKIYPNPANDLLTIEANKVSYSACTISNIMGQMVRSQELKKEVTQVDISSLPAGIYYITLRGEGGITTQKFEKL